MFVLRTIMPVTSALASAGHLLGAKKAEKYLNSKFYRGTTYIRKNAILNRAMIEALGAEVPTVGTELIFRNWQKAVGDALRMSLYIAAVFFIPLGIIPLWNKRSAAKNNLPKEFSENFELKYEDVLPETDTPEGNAAFEERLIELEGEEKVTSFLVDCGGSREKELEKMAGLKKKMLKAKRDVMSMDLMSAGIITYQVPWIQNIFDRYVLGVIGFTGELDYKSDSERSSDYEFFGNTKWLRYGLGYIPTIWGAKWYSKKVYDVASSPRERENKSKFNGFLRDNIGHFDYFKKIYSNKLNVLGTYLFGGDAGFVLSVKSVANLIERVLRLAVLYPTGYWGDQKIHTMLSERSDKTQGTELLDRNAPKDLGMTKIKSLEELEKELTVAVQNNDNTAVERITKSIQTSNRHYWSGIAGTSVLMGIGLTGANIFGTSKYWFGLTE